MKLEMRVEGRKATMKISGKMVAQTLPDLNAAVKKLDDSVCELIIDISDVNFVSSAGLRGLASAYKLMAGRGGVMVLMHPTDEVEEILDTTGLADVFAIER